MQLHRGLGAQAGHTGQLDDAGGHLAAELLKHLHRAGVEVLHDLLGGRGADPGDVGQRGPVDLPEVNGRGADRAG